MKFVLRGIRQYIGIKVYLLFAVALTVAVLMSCFEAGELKTVSFNNNGLTAGITTMKTTVGELLDEMGVAVRDEDHISLPRTARLTSGTLLEFKKAVSLNITLDGKNVTLLTAADTVHEALEANSIIVRDTDKITGAALNDKITDGLSMKVVRVNEATFESKETIPYSVVRKDNNFLAYGNENIVTEGMEGLKNVKFSVKYEDGVEISRTLISEEIIVPPVTAVIERGTILSFNASRGAAFKYTQVFDMLSTAYTCPGNIGVTYSGLTVRRGVVAVDPKVIPLGTLLYIEVPGGEDYGYAIAADIGGAINGDRIDVYIEDYASAVYWGLKNVKVYVLQ